MLGHTMLAWLTERVAAPVLAYGEVLTPTEKLIIGAIIALVFLGVIIALLYRSRKGPVAEISSCPQCGSVNMSHRAGLTVCMDCGYSVKATEAEA
jgi:ribosomal protein L32